MKSKDTTVIQATNLASGYGQKSIWSGANFGVQKGEFVGVLGPNGAGKTTLLRLLLGLSKPLKGKLSVLGEAPRRGNPRIGYVSQRHLIDDEFNIEAIEVVRMGLNGTNWGFALPGVARNEYSRALRALESVDSANLSHRPLGQLSGGELQRVLLAQALVGKPEILLLDEPLANLDIRRETELVHLIASVAKNEQVTVLLIAHDLNPLLPVVDRLIYVVNSKLATGKPKEIVTSKKLSELYGAPIEVLRDKRGRIAVLGTEEAVHHD